MVLKKLQNEIVEIEGAMRELLVELRKKNSEKNL